MPADCTWQGCLLWGSERSGRCACVRMRAWAMKDSAKGGTSPRIIKLPYLPTRMYCVPAASVLSSHVCHEPGPGRLGLTGVCVAAGMRAAQLKPFC